MDDADEGGLHLDSFSWRNLVAQWDGIFSSLRRFFHHLYFYYCGHRALTLETAYLVLPHYLHDSNFSIGTVMDGLVLRALTKRESRLVFPTSCTI